MPRTAVVTSEEQIPEPAKIDQPGPGTKRSIEDRAKSFVAERTEKYDGAIASARAAAATTATPAWQANYSEQRDAHRKLVRSCTETITKAAARINDFGTNEDDEKEVKDSVKGLADERIRHEAWKGRTVYAYSSTVDRCRGLRQEPVQEATRLEEQQPLISRGFAAAVSKLVDAWPVAKWDNEAGVVTVEEPVNA